MDKKETSKDNKKKASFKFGFVEEPTNIYELLGFIAFLIFVAYIITITRQENSNSGHIYNHM